MKLKCSLYHSYPLCSMIPYDSMVFDSDMHISNLSLKQLHKAYFNHDVLQSSILHLRTTSSSCTHYQNLSLKEF